MRWLLNALFVVFFSTNFLFATQKVDRKIRYKIEDLILEKNKDSALYYLNNQPKTEYLQQLYKLVESDFTSLKLHRVFLPKVSLRYANNYKKVSDFIDEVISFPKTNQEIDFDFVMIKWNQFSYLLNDRFIDESYEVYKNLEKYINQFDISNPQVAKANLRIKTHPIIIHIIKKETEKGKKLAKECIEKAKELNDLELQVIFNQHLISFYVEENKLDLYIKTAEETLEIAKQINNKEQYYMLLMDLVNAYIYKGGYEEQVLSSLEELYDFEHTKGTTYIFYTQFVSSNASNKDLMDRVFKKFEVNSILGFVTKIQPICKKNLVDNDYIKFLNYASNALYYDKQYKEAFNLKEERVQLTREVYSKKLSESLAKYEVDQAVAAKQNEVQIEREKAKLYLIIACLCFVLLVVSFFVIKKIRKQSKLLAQKNEIINQSLDEKELLVKEVHHRVKNNFQIITSLLDLQNEEIKDKNILDVLEKGKNRVKSMALVHQKLYLNKTGLIDIKDFIESLFKEITQIYKFNKDIVLKTEVDHFLFDVDTANPLALILNEIITNSFKYAFENDVKNELFISLKKDKSQNYILIVRDNGKTISETIDFENNNSFGLKLVKRLTKQLHGTFNIIKNEGVTVEITFKDTITRKQQT